MEESTVVREENEKKRRKLRSKVWDDFTKTEPSGEDGKEWAICNYCGAEFDGWSKKGTTHLKNHLASKTCRDKRNEGNEDKSTKTRDKSTIPLVMEEKSSLIDLIKQNFNEYKCETKSEKASVLNSRKDEILQLYQKEKKKLGEFLSTLSCRFSLFFYDGRCECFDVSGLVVHYIDDSWKRQSKTIGILPHDFENWIEETKKVSSELKIDRNICCIILNDWDWMKDGDDEVTEIWCSQRGSLPFGGFAFEFYGFLRIIQNFIEDWEMNEISEMAEFVDYISKKNFNFNNTHSNHSWYANFECLKVAVGLKEVFSLLQEIDPNFISINLIDQQWDKATATLPHLNALEEFYESSLWDRTSSIATIVAEFLKLFGFHRSEACLLCKDASYKQLFDSIKVYSIIVILDPRFKMDLIKFWYEGIHDSDDDSYFEKIFKYFRDIYNEYAKDSCDDYKMMDTMGRPSTSSTKSEFDLYLHDLKVPAVQDFDILAWWRGNALFYPTLARMARDYLAIPFDPNRINSTLEDDIETFSFISEFDKNMKVALIKLRGLLD